MERSKMLPGKRPSKNKVHPPADLIALGSKSRPGSTEPEPKVPSSSSKKALGGDRKGSIPGSSGIAPKKPKMGVQTFTPLGGRHLEGEKRGSPTTQLQQYEEMAKEVDPSELLDGILDAEDTGNDTKIESLLCGAVKYLKLNRAKPEPAVFLTLMWLSKARPTFFESEVVIEAFCSLLKRDISASFKAKGNALVPVLTCNILMASFQDEENWPDSFLKVYMEDSLGERVWVDRRDCKGFVDNIQTAFNTKMPKLTVPDPTKPEGGAGSPNPSLMAMDDEDKSMDTEDMLDQYGLADDGGVTVFPRYTYQQVSVESYVLDLIREQLSRRQPIDAASRNLLRVMTAACGYSEVRLVAAQKLEMWLQNPKLTRSAQDLLMSVCLNCDQHSQYDVEVMSLLCKIRLKTKPLISHYHLCIRELLSQHESNLHTLMTHTVYNELSQARNPNNMTLISIMFSHAPDQAGQILAEIFLDLLTNKDDYLRALRTLLREIVRVTRSDMNFAALARGMMQTRRDSKFQDLETQFKDRMLLSTTDLITTVALLSVTPAVREAASAHNRGDPKDLEVLRNFQRQLSVIQRDAVWWLHSEVPSMYKIKPNDYTYCLRKVLFIEKGEAYFKIDNWPPEAERGVIFRLVSEVPVMEDTLMRVLLIGLTQELHLTPADAIDLAYMLVRRSAPLHSEDFPVLQIERLGLVDALLNLCTYHHPDNIPLPKGYTAPTLAITALYWKAWVMLLIIAAYNPATFGRTAWDEYPILRCFMEMSMTNHYKFPPPTMVTHDKAAEDIKNKERQVAEVEKQEILEFEMHLAAATSKVTITEANSLLLSQVTRMEPSGQVRKPHAQVLEQLKQLNAVLSLGNLLCRSRKPDFLLEIIQRQGTSQSMPWLANLVESNEGSLEVLPVQCLCEFLLHDQTPGAKTDEDEEESSKTQQQRKQQKQQKQEQLLLRLQCLVCSEDEDVEVVKEILGYFFRRLASSQTSNRELAVKGLSMVLSKSQLPFQDDMETDEDSGSDILPEFRWLLDQLPSLPQFAAVKESICSSLRQAIQVESSVEGISAYIMFLAKHTADLQPQEMDALALDLAQLIVERSTLMNYVLPAEGSSDARSQGVLASFLELFHCYLDLSQQQNETYSWSNTQDQVLLHWKSDESATMNILVVHAMVILLTYGEPEGESRFRSLLHRWFPEGGHPPSAFLVDTSEEALLLPDWLKLRMIRSSVGRLVDAALVDLEPAQLVLFVQSFGIPVASMAKLLRCLDMATENDLQVLEHAIVDKGYMAQLVEVQQMRGVDGGYIFHNFLTRSPRQQESGDVEMKPASRKRRTMSQLCRAGELPTTTQTGDVLAILVKLFVEPETPTVQRQQLFRALQKTILKKPEMIETVLTAMKEIVFGPDGKRFVEGLHRHSHTAAALLRWTGTAKADQLSLQVTVLERMVSLSGDRSSTMSRLCAQQLGRIRGDSLSTQMLTPEPKALEQVIERMGQTGDTRLETCLTLSNCQAIRLCDLSGRVSMLCQLLERTKNNTAMRASVGLLLDWLELLAPEMVSLSKDLQQRLLFPPQGGATDAHCYHAYLLAMLTHQSDWSSLRKCIDLLLSPQENSYDATIVLDFLWACTLIPKLWQGRDRKLPKNYVPEDVLNLSTPQLQSLTKLIICEACTRLQPVGKSSHDSPSTSHDTTSGDPSHDALPPAARDAIVWRIKLLLLCCGGSTVRVKVVTDFIDQTMKEHKYNTVVCQDLLIQIYLRLPSVITSSVDLSLLTQNLSATRWSSSQLDTVSHQLFTSLGNTAPGKQCENRMYDANIACRKLAASYPALVLRQLPMVAALLQGRSQFVFGQLKNKNHLLLYTHVLGILELLQPYLFHEEYTKPLEEILKSYFDLLREHGLQNHHLASIVTKFFKLVANFVSADSCRACGLLHKHINVLTALGQQYPDFTTLRTLLAILSLPRQESISTEKDTSATCMQPPRPSSPWNLSQLAPFLHKLRKGTTTEDVLDVLRDLDETSKRKVDILSHFLGELQRLLCDQNETIRNSAHMLVRRHIRQHPGSAEDFVDSFLHCLESGDPDVITSALRNLPEFTLLAQGHAQTLLQKAFEVGVKFKIETETFLTEAVQWLNLETVL